MIVVYLVLAVVLFVGLAFAFMFSTYTTATKDIETNKTNGVPLFEAQLPITEVRKRMDHISDPKFRLVRKYDNRYLLNRREGFTPGGDLYRIDLTELDPTRTQLSVVGRPVSKGYGGGVSNASLGQLETLLKDIMAPIPARPVPTSGPGPAASPTL